jgi:hypothetical protein
MMAPVSSAQLATSASEAPPRMACALSSVADVYALSVPDIFAEAGRRVGIGDFRPERKGPFGKFQVVEFVEQQ